MTPEEELRIYRANLKDLEDKGEGESLEAVVLRLEIADAEELSNG